MRGRLVRKWVVAGDDDAPRLMPVVPGRPYAHFQVFDTELAAWRHIEKRTFDGRTAAEKEAEKQKALWYQACQRIAELEKADEA